MPLTNTFAHNNHIYSRSEDPPPHAAFQVPSYKPRKSFKLFIRWNHMYLKWN